MRGLPCGDAVIRLYATFDRVSAGRSRGVACIAQEPWTRKSRADGRGGRPPVADALVCDSYALCIRSVSDSYALRMRSGCTWTGAYAVPEPNVPVTASSSSRAAADGCCAQRQWSSAGCGVASRVGCNSVGLTASGTADATGAWDRRAPAGRFSTPAMLAAPQLPARPPLGVAFAVMTSTGTGTERLAQALSKLPALAQLPDYHAFERLAAMVVHRWLQERTVHDVILRGGSQAPHQIDVLVGDDRQRALIECKYYGRVIDMPVVRNFYGAVEDLGCDLAAIISTVGFSRNVKTYAAAKGIDLLLLRDSRTADLEGRVQRIGLELTIFGAHLRTCRVVAPPDVDVDVDDGQQMSIALDDPNCVLEHASGRRVPFVKRYHELFASFGFDDADGVYPVTDEFQAPTWLLVGDTRVPVQRIEWEWVVSRSTTTSIVEHEPLVSLVSSDGDVLEVVSEEQLRRTRFDRDDAIGH